MERAIVTEGLTKIYKSGKRQTEAVRDLTLEVKRGEVFGFIGPNGAGKSTTIKMLLSILYPTSGRAWIFGLDARSPDSRKKVGYLPENPRFYDYLSGEEFLRFVGMLAGLSGAKLERKVESLLRYVGIYDARKRKLRKYSKGMIQRIGLAQALMGDPDLIILDEPTSGLDPLGRKLTLDLIRSLRSRGKTIFFSTHILKDVEEIANRVGILYKGKLLKVFSLDEERRGSGDYQIEIENAGIDLLAAAEKLAEPSKKNENRITFIVKEDSLFDFLEIVRDKGGEIVSMARKKRNLEEIFLETIGKG
ncbi:MAG: ABC transporter ATP-binding protein [Candidatus Hydrothermota bacterium]|nr:MAG: ABC transporter ATP-binding protein [Candidatus Hydrothermae bacterium]RKZ04094.1 MAG: ABC transporter ATP-binding protein [Candidatus Hydrothermae bacterium]